MPKFLYVMAVVSPPLNDPGSISFISAFVEAEEEQGAYFNGYQRIGSPTAGPGQIMNDYVVLLEQESA